MSAAPIFTPEFTDAKDATLGVEKRTPTAVITPHDVAPEYALDALQHHVGPILLDLDETLYLRNSTEDFIDSAVPGLMALLLMKMLDAIKPWRWTGGDATRDVWRVRLIYMCMPWTLRRWKRRVVGLAEQFGNFRLLAALKPLRNHTVIATDGFQSIVTPLIAALGLAHVRVVAARLSFDDRLRGKLSRLLSARNPIVVRNALVLTDSSHDSELLNACVRPLRTIWPDALYRPALIDVYLPGRYLTKVKRPGTRYIVRGIVQEDFAFWILSSIALAALPIPHVLGLLALLFSFWVIYERGYVDNDLIAARFETQPKLTPQFTESPVATPRWQPWGWAFVSGAVAIFLLRWPLNPLPLDFAVWGTVLLATYGWFLMYNRFDKATRVWLFAGLQFARSAAFVALVPIELIGAIALGAHVLAKWVPYFVYRLGGKEWPDAPVHLIRLMFFILLALLLAFSSGPSAVLNWTAAALLLWNLFRARQEMNAARATVQRLDHLPKAST